LSLVKKILFAVIVNVAFFAALELLLAAFGVTPITYSEDPFVGFTSRSPLFEAAELPEGRAIYRTVPKKEQWFNPQEFAAPKPANGYRIFCIGESTTYGHPYFDATSYSGFLREYLRAAEPRRAWEVINVGGISYASYRIAFLMEELIKYEPDLFIIYVGQNEFLERRTYSRLIETPRAVRETAGVLAQSRVYSSLHRLLKRSRAGASDASVLPDEVEAILDGTVGPDDYQRDDEQRSQVVAHYRYNMSRMVEIAKSVGARVLFVMPAVNERSMSPFKSQHRDDLKPDELARWETLVAAATAEQQAGTLDEALSSLDQALEIDPRYADTHFQRGGVLYALQRYPEAKQAFQRAIDEDVCPLRMLSEMRPVIREIAAQNQVEVVDFQELLEAKSESRITGEESFLDHVHPNMECYRDLALKLFDELQSEGIVVPGPEWTPAARQQVDTLVMARLDERAQALALRTLGKTLSWARKYEEAGRLAQQASATLSDDAEVHCMAGYDFERKGQLDQAIESYKKALEVWPEYAHAHYNLGHVYRRQKKLDLATQEFQRAIDGDPRYPGAHYNLGLLYAEADQLDLAAQCFTTSTTINDKHPGSWEELGNVRLRQGNAGEARKYLQRAIELEPNLASAHNSLGIVYAQSGQMDQAIASFERALAISPGYESAQQNLARARRSSK